jgi:hypothetical protein
MPVRYTGTGWHGRVPAIIYVHIFTEFFLSFLPRIITVAKNDSFSAFTSIREKTLLKVALSKRTLSNLEVLGKVEYRLNYLNFIKLIYFF